MDVLVTFFIFVGVVNISFLFFVLIWSYFLIKRMSQIEMGEKPRKPLWQVVKEKSASKKKLRAITPNDPQYVSTEDRSHT